MGKKSTPKHERLLNFIPLFEQADFDYGHWNNVEHSMPMYHFSPDVQRFVEILYDDGWIMDFPWTQWQSTAEELHNNQEKLNSATLDTLRKLLTVHVRKERFCEGHLNVMFRSGHILKILKRIEIIIDSN